MTNPTIPVPVALLLDPNLQPALKVLWIATRHHPTNSPAELVRQTGLSRPTVLRGLDELAACHPSTTGPRVKIPPPLLAERAVGAQAKVLYGLLQTIPTIRGQSGQFTYASLAALTGLSRNTLKLAMTDLVGARWVQVTQENRLSPIHFTLSSPDQIHSQLAVALAERRLGRAKHGGEALMKEYLSLLIDSNDFTDNARPGFLVNPLTGEPLELDRFYPPGAAFEFHGAQHDRPTERFTEAEVQAQQLRDTIKAGLCLYREIHLVIIRAKDLSLTAMRRRIGDCLPLRNLAGNEPLVELLEEASLRYYAGAEAARKAGT